MIAVAVDVKSYLLGRGGTLPQLEYCAEHCVEAAFLGIRRQQLTIFVTGWYADASMLPLVFYATH